jgi:hypothetical protein
VFYRATTKHVAGAKPDETIVKVAVVEVSLYHDRETGVRAEVMCGPRA